MERDNKFFQRFFCVYYILEFQKNVLYMTKSEECKEIKANLTLFFLKSMQIAGFPGTPMLLRKSQ